MKAAQRNLPHNTTYKAVSFFHTGGIDNGCPCDNCGKMLSSVAVVQSGDGKQYNVGLDCAATLATVDPMEFDATESAFAEGRKVRAAILKGQKGHEAKFSVTPYLSSNGEDVVIEGRAAASRLFMHYVSIAAFEAVVKPLCGSLLPAGPLPTSEEYNAQQSRAYYASLPIETVQQLATMDKRAAAFLQTI